MTPHQSPLFPVCQRWNHGRTSYRPAGEVIDPDQYHAELIDERTAKHFILTHHYSRSYPAARCRVGLFEARPHAAPALVGVAVFSVPINQHSLPCYCGIDAAHGVELGRFCLMDHVKANGETFFLRLAVRHLRAALPDIRAVLAYADPVPRRTITGLLLTPG